MSQLVAIDPVIPGNFEIVWEPQPGSQTLALTSPAQHTLYEGARGPGKTVTQLMRFYRNVGKGYGEFWRGIIFDLEFDDLNGIVTESKKWFNKIGDGAKWLGSASLYKWVWPTGEELLFRHAKKESDYEGFHGHEYPFLGWNELTKHPNGKLYEKMMSVNRSSFNPIKNTPKDDHGNYMTPDRKPLPPIPLEVFSTTNPNGPGHNWVKRKFIDVAPRGTIVRTEVEIFNPSTQSNDKVIKTQVAIFGSYRENRYLPPEYIAELESITDENLKRAWLYGDWDVTAGGAFDDKWDRRYNVIPRFIVPKNWTIKRSFDWGSTHPFSVGWWTEANGEEVELLNGKVWCPPKHSLIRIFEWYGCKLKEDGSPDIGRNEGLKLGAKEIAEGIRDREISLMENGWILTQPIGGPADNQIRNVNEAETETIEKKMADVGISWTPSDKSPGSRAIGLQLTRDMIDAAKTGEEPALYVFDCCRAFIGTVPTLTRDKDKPDDVNTKEEDHIYDETRYMILSGKDRYAKSVKLEHQT
jgi:hypothetical protein